MAATLPLKARILQYGVKKGSEFTIDDIMRDYYIVEINQAYVVFTEKKNRKAYSDWNLFYKPESLYMEE